jgi:hypothetical protein
MNRKLEENMCKLPDGATNSEVDDLRERTERYIDRALQYACRSWHKHLVHTTPAHILGLIPVLHRFLEEKLLFWLEVLSVLGAAREAVDALDLVSKRLDVRSAALFYPFQNSLGPTRFRPRQLWISMALFFRPPPPPPVPNSYVPPDASTIRSFNVEVIKPLETFLNSLEVTFQEADEGEDPILVQSQ